MKKRVLIFLIIGLVLYYLDLSINSDQDKDIYISDQEIISLITAWESQVGRTPNDNEIARIINNKKKISSKNIFFKTRIY